MWLTAKWMLPLNLENCTPESAFSAFSFPEKPLSPLGGWKPSPIVNANTGPGRAEATRGSYPGRSWFAELDCRGSSRHAATSRLKFSGGGRSDPLLPDGHTQTQPTSCRVSQVMTERNSATAELTAKKGGLSKRATIRDIRGYREL